MGSVEPESKRLSFWGYPEALEGPHVPYVNKPKPNPTLRGRILWASANIMEWVRPVREQVWWDAGFGSLRKVRHEIEDYEPLHELTVVPFDARAAGAADAPDEEPAPTAEPAASPSRYPEAQYYSASTYRRMYLSGEITPTDVARAILPLIRRDVSPKGQHHLAFFDSKVDQVMKMAEAATKRYKEGRSLGPLDGVPCAVKDEYDMDGYTSNLGSLNDYTTHFKEDGSINNWCVRNLLEAGVVIVGKTSMVEFGLDVPGNNPNYGTPPNPFNKEYYTGGSSSGTAYAVSAGLIPIGLGSDGGGSIRIPSAFCGVFGIKPTHGRLSFRPGQNHCISCACLGPLAADVESLATVLSVVAQPHPASPFALPGVPRLPSPARMLSPDPQRRPRLLGVPTAWFEDSEAAVQQLCRGMIDTLAAKHGYAVIPVDIPLLPQGQTAHALTVLTDAATLLPEYGNLTYANRILLALGRTTPAADYLRAQKVRRLLAQHLAHLWRAHPGLLLVTPATGRAGWRMADPRPGGGELRWGVSDGDKTLETMRFVWMANFLGLPAITCPAGFVAPAGDGGREEGPAVAVADADTEGKIPVGLMATGEWASEESLIRFGLDVEAAGAALRCRPPAWTDVIALAKRAREVGGGGPGC